MNRKLYILGDADHVRDRVEGYLLSGELGALKLFSESLDSGLHDLTRSAEDLWGAEIIMAGGDEFLLCMEPSSYSRKTLESLLKSFLETTGCSISCGVGAEVSVAYLNLRRAKAAGGAVIVDGGART